VHGRRLYRRSSGLEPLYRPLRRLLDERREILECLRTTGDIRPC
jgi:hypothetical protein